MSTASLLSFGNDGARLTASNYWETEYARRSLMFLSINAGCFRLLLPEALGKTVVEEMRSADHIVISMLPLDAWRDGQFAVEWMAEDSSDEPWCAHLSPGQVDRGPKREDRNPTWEARVYLPGPTEALVLPAHLRFTPRLPCRVPLAETIRRASKGDA